MIECRQTKATTEKAKKKKAREKVNIQRKAREARRKTPTKTLAVCLSTTQVAFARVPVHASLRFTSVYLYFPGRGRLPSTATSPIIGHTAKFKAIVSPRVSGTQQHGAACAACAAGRLLTPMAGFECAVTVLPSTGIQWNPERWGAQWAPMGARVHCQKGGQHAPIPKPPARTKRQKLSIKRTSIMGASSKRRFLITGCVFCYQHVYGLTSPSHPGPARPRQ